jgi:hypothetical protein
MMIANLLLKFQTSGSSVNGNFKCLFVLYVSEK